jgi:hypothetical protein
MSYSDGFLRVISVIQAMISSGDIKSAIGNDLISKLKAAQKYLPDKPKSALNSINMVVVKLKDLKTSQQLEAEKADYLLNMCHLIIADINDGTKSGKLTITIDRGQTEST